MEAVLKIVAVVVGVLGHTGYVDPAEPTDNTGRTSIIVIMGDPDSDNWVELRGPGRWDALEEFGSIVRYDE